MAYKLLHQTKISIHRVLIRNIACHPIKHHSILKQRLLASSSKKLFTSHSNNNNNTNNNSNNKSNVVESIADDKTMKAYNNKNKSNFDTILWILKGTVVIGCVGGIIMYQNANRKRINMAKHQTFRKLVNPIGLGLCLYLIGLNGQVMDIFNCDVNDIIITKGSIQLSKANKMGTTIQFIITNPEKSVFGQVTYFILNVWSQSLHTDYNHMVELTVHISDQYGNKPIVTYKGTSQDIENINPVIYPYYYFDENKQRKPTKIKRESEDQVLMLFVPAE